MPPRQSLTSHLHRQLNRAPLLLPLACLLGIQLGSAGAGYSTVYYGIPVLALLYLLWQRRGRLLLVSLLICSYAVYQLEKNHANYEQARDCMLSSPELELEGTLVRRSEYSALLEIDKHAPLKVQLRGRLSGELGDLVRIHGTPRPLPSAAERLPGSFDQAAWFHSNYIACSIDVQSMDILDHPPSWAALRGQAARWRALLLRQIIPDSPETDRGESIDPVDPRRQVLAALVLGEKDQADAETLELFQWSGGLHAFAVSGLHVGIVAGLLWLSLRLLSLLLQRGLGLTIPSRWSITCIILSVGLYVFLTGMAVSSLRAYLMLVLILSGFLLRRQISPINLLAAVALASILISPQQLAQAGFLLSFLVYAGILLVVHGMGRSKAWFGPDSYLPRALYTPFEHGQLKLEAFIRGNILISVTAWLISLPILMVFFGSWNPYGILTNILIAPLLPLVMGLGLLLLCTAGIPYLGGIVTSLALQASGLLLGTVSLTANLDGSYLPTTAPAARDAGIILDLGYGKTACQLGNGGLLIADGNDRDARWRLRPALFSSGYTPSSYLADREHNAEAQLPILRALWKELRSVQTEGVRPLHLLSEEVPRMSWSIYPAPLHLLARPLVGDRGSLVIWERGEDRVLYIGNASALSYEYWQEQGVDMDADIIILGYNEKQPLIREEWMVEGRESRLILLPSFPSELEELFNESAHTQSMRERAVIGF